MLRAVEFAARLDFEIEAATWDAILEHRDEILKASPARVSEEILELLRRGWSLAAVDLLAQTATARAAPAGAAAAPGRGRRRLLLDDARRARPDGPKRPEGFRPGPSFGASAAVHHREHRGGIARPRREASGGRDDPLRAGADPADRPAVLRSRPGCAIRSEQAIETLWRLLEPPTDRRSMWRFVFREPFNDGLALLELYARASGNYLEVARQWQSFAQRVRSEEPRAPVAAPRRRRRRR